MLKRFDELYSKIIKESLGSYDDAAFMANAGAELQNNRSAIAQKILKKYPVKTRVAKCPVCGKETAIEDPDIPFSATDKKFDWDREAWQKGLSKEDKVLRRTGKCYDCQRGGTPAPTGNDVDPEI